MTKYSIVRHRGNGISPIEKILLQSEVIALKNDRDFQEFLKIVNEANAK